MGSSGWLQPGKEILKFLSVHLGLNSDHPEKEDHLKMEDGKFLVI